MSPSIDLNNSQTLIFIARQEYVTSASMRFLISDSVKKNIKLTPHSDIKGVNFPPSPPHTLPKTKLTPFQSCADLSGYI